MAGADEPQQRANQKRWQMRPNLQRFAAESRGFPNRPDLIYNHLIFKRYFLASVLHFWLQVLSFPARVFFAIGRCRRDLPITTCFHAKSGDI
jgi:hypothetical protein